jgi:hypothetical protein
MGINTYNKLNGRILLKRELKMNCSGSKILNSQNGTGYLYINVYSNATSTPIANAFVRVSRISYSGQFNEFAQGMLLGEYITDENGSFAIELPALNELLPNNKDYYIVTVRAYGYYNAYIFNVQIYEDHSTSYRVFLSPVTQDVELYNIITEPTIREIHER